MNRPIAIDLFCGLGGWTEGLLAEGYYVIGFDNERHVYGDHAYPAQLVLQDVRTLHGSQFRDAALIVASPPCQEYSYMAMPWTRAKQIARALRGCGEFPEGYTGSRTITELNELFDTCFRIQREASEAAGRHIPLVVENVKGAQPWVGRARWNFGSFYLWGDVPALMPIVHRAQKVPGFRFDGSGRSFQTAAVEGVQDWSRFRRTGEKSPHWNVSATKNAGGSWFRVAHNTTSGKGRNPDGRPLPPHTPHMTNPNEHGVKHSASGAAWLDSGPAAHGSRSPKRKAASAMIAKIPIDLARHIGAVYHPEKVT